jgi:hypothetical protein
MIAINHSNQGLKTVSHVDQELHFLLPFIAVGFSQLFKIDSIQWASAPFISTSRFSHDVAKSYCCLINGAKAPASQNYPFNSQLKLTAINIPSITLKIVKDLHNRMLKKIKQLRYFALDSHI